MMNRQRWFANDAVWAWAIVIWYWNLPAVDCWYIPGQDR
jgi:hypothetical protein